MIIKQADTPLYSKLLDVVVELLVTDPGVTHSTHLTSAVCVEIPQQLQQHIVFLLSHYTFNVLDAVTHDSMRCLQLSNGLFGVTVCWCTLLFAVP